MVKSLFLFCASLCLSVPGAAGAVKTSNTVDSLKNELSKARNPQDSLSVYYDLFDVSERAVSKQYGWKILDISERTGNAVAQGDMLRQLASLYLKNDTVLEQLEEHVRYMPDGADKKAVALFIRLQRTTNHVTFLSDDDRHEQLLEMLAEHTDDTTDNIFDDVRQLYILCMYLGNTVQGNVYYDHLQKLGYMVKKLPQAAYSIRMQYLTTSAFMYTSHGEHAKAVAADRELLRNVDLIEKKYESQGRKFRHYDMRRYICYRRMLANYEALTSDEIDDIYSRIKHLQTVNEDVKADVDANPRVDAYYLVAKGRYAEAIPLLRRQLLNDETVKPIRRQMFALMRMAAEQTGDKETLIFALKGYNDALEEYLDDVNTDSYREMEIRYEVDDLKERNNRLELDRRDAKVSLGRKVILISLVAAFVLVVVLLLLHHRYGKVKVRNFQIEKELDMVRKENERLNRINDELMENSR